MQVVVEAQAVALQAAVESALARMPKRRMADIVDQGKGFGQIFVEAERCCDIASDLDDLDRMGEAAAKVVRSAAGKDLRLARKPAEGARLHDPLTIALERGPRRAQRGREDAGVE